MREDRVEDDAGDASDGREDREDDQDEGEAVEVRSECVAERLAMSFDTSLRVSVRQSPLEAWETSERTRTRVQRPIPP